MANEALRTALNARQMTPSSLAEQVGVDPKTVSRWLGNPARVPHPKTRWAVADALEVDEVALWPDVARTVLKVGPDKEVLTVYPTHSATPPAVWRKLIVEAREQISLAGYAPHWLWRYVPHLDQLLLKRARAGCRVRIVVGSTDNPLVTVDEAATGAPITLTSRVAEVRHLLQPLAGAVEVRVSALGWGRSVYRGDDEAMADWWLHGHQGVQFPVLHLRRHVDGGMFDALTAHFEALWGDAEPLT